jgi:hypothetical protein
MTTLAADKKRAFGADSGELDADGPVIAADISYEGAAVGESSSDGTARPLSGGDTFLGFCVRKVDNSSGSAGDKKVRVLLKGTVRLPVTGLDNNNDLGAAVYASDDDTFTLTSSSAFTQIGKVAAYEGTSGYGLVYFEAAMVRSI